MAQRLQLFFVTILSANSSWIFVEKFDFTKKKIQNITNPRMPQRLQLFRHDSRCK